jgi:hypothetical protein
LGRFRLRKHLERTVSTLSKELKEIDQKREDLIAQLEKYEEEYVPESDSGPSPAETAQMGRSWIRTIRRMLAETISAIFMVSEEDEESITALRDEAREFLTKEVAAKLMEIVEILGEAEKAHALVMSRTFSDYAGTASDFDRSLIRLHEGLREKLLIAGSTIGPIFEGSMTFQKRALSRIIKDFILVGVKD